MVKPNRITRRGALKLGAATATLPLVHIRSGRAAGKLSMAFWDHWVPKGNDVLQSQVNTWAKQNQVDVSIDFITGNGGKLQTTGVAELMAKTGHDFFTFLQWDVHNVAGALAPVDDLMARLIAKNGAVNPTAEYLAKSSGHWSAVPTPLARRPSRPARASAGSRSTGSTCARCIR